MKSFNIGNAQISRLSSQLVIEAFVEFNRIQGFPIIQSNGCSNAYGSIIIVGYVVGTTWADTSILGYEVDTIHTTWHVFKTNVSWEDK